MVGNATSYGKNTPWNQSSFFLQSCSRLVFSLSIHQVSVFTKPFVRSTPSRNTVMTTSSVMHIDVRSGHETSSMPFPQQPYSADPPAYKERETEKPPVPEVCHADQRPQQCELKKVVIPDLFVSFISQRPRPNPYYEVVKKESEAWMKQYDTAVPISSATARQEAG